MKKGNWKIEIWQKSDGHKLLEQLVLNELKPIAMNNVLNNFIFNVAINQLHDLDRFEFVIMKLD